MKVLLKRFHLNGHTIGFQQQTQKSQLYIILIVPCESTSNEVSFVSSHHMSKGWCSGESTRLSPMWLGFEPWRRRICGLSLLLVLSFALRGFLRVLRFSPLQKNQHCQFQFDQESGRRRTTLWMCYLQIIIYLFMISPKDSNNRTTNYLNSAMWKYREEVSHHRISSTDLKVTATY